MSNGPRNAEEQKQLAAAQARKLILEQRFYRLRETKELRHKPRPKAKP